jgi:hypothetical protein
VSKRKTNKTPSHKKVKLFNKQHLLINDLIGATLPDTPQKEESKRPGVQFQLL